MQERLGATRNEKDAGPSRSVSVNAAEAGMTMKAKTGSAPMDMMDTAIVKAMVKSRIRLKSRVLIPQAVAVSGSSEVKTNSLYSRRWISNTATAVTTCTRSCSTETNTELT